MNDSKNRLILEFVHRENVEHFRRLLKATIEENQRKRILALLAEEDAKQDQSDPERQK